MWLEPGECDDTHLGSELQGPPGHIQGPRFCFKYNVKTLKVFMISFMNLRDHSILLKLADWKRTEGGEMLGTQALSSLPLM